MPPAGANSRSPTNAAQRASVTISFGSSDISAFSPRIVSRRPPPTMSRGETFSPRFAVAPETKKITTVAGR